MKGRGLFLIGTLLLLSEVLFGQDRISPLSEVMVLAKGAMGEEPAYPHLELLEKGTDWFDEIFRLDSVRNYQIGLSGGAENVSYNLSVGFFQ